MSIIDINSYKLSMRTCFILLYIVRDVDMYFIQDNSYVIEFLQTYIRYTKKNLKIPKGQSESVYRTQLLEINLFEDFDLSHPNHGK
jgi:hypothetical protein